MSAPTFSHSPSAVASSRAIPPYAGPSRVSSELSATQRVGPFVPAAQRQAALPDRAAAAVAAPVTATPIAAMPAVVTTATPTPTIDFPAVQASATEMAVPASIPPYRPFRPTPIISPAIRTPLYIPPIATPTGELVVEDEGVIEPQIVDTAEFAVPQRPVDTPSVPEPATADANELPWIDAFLASTPSLPLSAIEDAAAEPPMALSTEVPVDQLASVEPYVPQEAPAVIPSEAVDEWPLEEAAEEFRVLRTAMDASEPHDVLASRHAAAADPAEAAPLPEWADDDLLDIMPIRHSGKTPLSSAAIPPDGELWAERARKAHEEAHLFETTAAAPAEEQDVDAEHHRGPGRPEATAEEAAHALELLARRVRAGELTLPAYDPRMGEPAALVAALAALLGVKLR